MCHFISSDISHVSQRARRFISRDHIQYVAKEAYQIPDSENCQKALAMVSEYSPDHLVNHCLRSYAFGIAMAYKAKQPFDKEVFFLGAIMHDLGLTTEFDSGNTFEIDGADAARSFCIEHALSAEKADLVHEMVVHHNSVGIAHKLDPEIALLHFGAGADVAGLWIKDIHKKTLSEVLSEFPRLDFKQGMIKLLSDQINQKPQSYMAPFIELGFVKKIENTPF
ncbi:HD domain-containing protein [bacterium]|nr:HD domain-containing protein [bacterium]